MKKFISSLLLVFPIIGFCKNLTNIELGKVIVLENYIELTSNKGHTVKIPINNDVVNVQLRLNYKNNKKDSFFLLFEQRTKDDNCPAKYFIFETNFQDLNKKSQVFGTCSNNPIIKPDNNSLTLIMPQLDGKSEVTFIYHKGRLSQYPK